LSNKEPKRVHKVALASKLNTEGIEPNCFWVPEEKTQVDHTSSKHNDLGYF